MSNTYFNNDGNYPLPRTLIESRDFFDILNRISRAFDQLPDTYGNGVKGFNYGNYYQPFLFSPETVGGTYGSVALPGIVTANTMRIPLVATAPSDTPETSSDTVELRYEGPANKLWVYNGAWRSVTLA